MRAVILEAKVDDNGQNRRVAANRRLTNPRLLIGDVPELQILEDDDLIIESKGNGMCGSDVHATEAGPDGHVKFSGPADPPVVLGHEFVGCVVDCGKDVSRFAKGDIVSAESIQGCGNC